MPYEEGWYGKPMALDPEKDITEYAWEEDAASRDAEVAELKQQLAAAQDDAIEQARIVGMGGEREVALLQKLDMVSSLLREAAGRMSYGHWSSEFRALVENALKIKVPKRNEQLAAAQEREALLYSKCNGYIADNVRLSDRVKTLEGEIKLIGAALNDPRVDLTMTMSELILELRQQLAKARTLIERSSAFIICDADPIAEVKTYTGSVKDMAIIVWCDEPPGEGTLLYKKKAK